MSSPRESSIQKRILLAVSEAFYPGFFWRQNAGKIQSIDGYWIELGPEGIGDIAGFLPGGRMVFIECKTRTGAQRKSQKAFQKAAVAAGAIYVVARSPEEAVKKIKAASR